MADASASLRLLRAKQNIVILSFLMSVFRREGSSVEVEHSKMKSLLEAHLEDTEFIPDDQEKKPRPVDYYLNTWVESGYLHRKTPLGAEEPIYTLSSEADRAIRFAESLKPRAFVGTEGRLRTIVNLLRDLDANTDPDVERRIRSLEDQRRALADQIFEIMQKQRVEVYSDTKVMELLSQAEEAARELNTAFTRVRELFADSVKEIATKQAEQGVTRGAVLERAIEQDDYLKSTAEGQSFYAFWNYLLASSGNSEIARLAEKLYEHPALPHTMREGRQLMRMSSTLMEEGRQVVSVNTRMSRQLRALLDTETIQRRHALLTVIGEIKNLAVQTRDIPTSPEFMTLPSREGMDRAMSRPNWFPSTTMKPTTVIEDDEPQKLTPEMARALFKAAGVTIARLKENIRATLKARGGNAGVFLADVLDEHPPKGVLELLGYMLIALENSDSVTPLSDDTFICQVTDGGGRFELPVILFHPEL